MKIKKLTDTELAIVDNLSDIVYLETIKGMNCDEMKSFDCYVPKDMRHYLRKQTEWISTERNLIGSRKGCSCYEINDEELLEDFNRCHNGERFKVFYCLKFPELVERKD